MKTCGTCEHAKFAKELPLGTRLCKGGPPQALLLPTPAGGVDLKYVWPLVAVKDEACGAWDARALSQPANVGPYPRIPLTAAAEAIDIAQKVGDGENEVDGAYEGRTLMEALSGH